MGKFNLKDVKWDEDIQLKDLKWVNSIFFGLFFMRLKT